VTVTLWLDTGEEETIELGATLPFYQAWAEIVRAGGKSFSDDYPDLAGVVSQCEDQEDADPDWLQDVRLQATNMLKEQGDSLSDRARAILSLLAGDEAPSGDKGLSPDAATFAEADPFDFGDISFGGLSREEIAEILIDAALDARDDAEFAEWDESKHSRGQPENKGEFGPGGGGKAERRARQEQYLARVEEVKKKINPRDAAAVQKLVRDLEKKTALDNNPGVDENALLAAMWRAGIAVGGTGLKQYQLLDRMVFTGLLSKGVSGGALGTPKAITYHLPMRQENHLIDGTHFAPAEFYDPNQIRDHRGRWTTGGGSGGSQGLPHVERQAQREGAKETVRRFMSGKGTPSLQEASGLAQALSALTVAQIHEVKREHGLKASAPDKAGLVKKLAERFRAARESKPAEPKPSESKATGNKASDLRREAVKSAIGETYSKYNGTHQLLQDIASSHDTLAGALAEAERQGLIDTRQRSPQSDVSPLQRDRQGEWVRRVLGQAYGEKEPANRLPTGAELERGTVTSLVSEASLPVGSTAKHDVATGTSPLFKVAIGGKDYFVKQIKGGSELAQAQGLGSLAVRGGDLDPIKGLRNETLTAGLAQIAGVPVPTVSATTFQGRQALVTEWLPGEALADVKDARSAVLKLPEGQVAQQLLFAYLADLSDRHLGNYFVSNNKLYSIDHEFGYDVHETDQHFQKREQIGRVFDNELFKLVGGPRHLTAGQGYDYPLPQSVVKGFAETASKMEATLREQGLHAEADAFAKRRAVVDGLATETKPTMGTLLERIGDPNAKRRSPEEQLLHDREQRLSFKEERHARGELNQAEIRSMGRLRERIQEQKKGMGKP
jgi:hypothetical protein